MGVMLLILRLLVLIIFVFPFLHDFKNVTTVALFSL